MNDARMQQGRAALHGAIRQRGAGLPSRILMLLLVALLLVVAFGVYKTLMPPATLGGQNQALAPCPSRPSCVFSGASEAPHAIAPLRSPVGPDATWTRLATIVLEMPGLKRITSEGDYLHAVFVTPTMRFRDDLELKLGDTGEITVRSASRFGYRDFGVNRERVERLRAALQGDGD